MVAPANTHSYTVSCVLIVRLKEMTWANVIYEKAQCVPKLFMTKKKKSGTFRCAPKWVSLQPLLLLRSQMSWLRNVVCDASWISPWWGFLSVSKSHPCVLFIGKTTSGKRTCLSVITSFWNTVRAAENLTVVHVFKITFDIICYSISFCMSFLELQWTKPSLKALISPM